MLKKSVALFSLALVAVVAIGCGKSNKPSDMGELGGCKVKVVQDGQPLQGATVEFKAVDPANQKYTPSGMTDDKAAAYTTLYTVLVTLAKITAPYVPFMAESIY
ncbi:MAG: class I tRNA ligase family protein, partial [Thermoguttaceae bacterium]|nr:class I tRNA ligase family protein [Thermoguttaceae bacterium]